MKINKTKRNIAVTIIWAVAVITALPYCVFVMRNGIAIALLIVTTCSVLMLVALWKNRTATIKMQFSTVEKEVKRRLILLNEAKALLWFYDSKALYFTTRLKDNNVLRTRYDIKEFWRLVAKESQDTLNFFRKSIAEKGSYHIRLKLTFDEGMSWHWHELCYTVTSETIRKHILTGMSLLIDDVVEREEKMIIAQRQNNEIKVKETFIENIGEGMTIPFNAIQQNSNLMVNDDGSLSIAEKQRLSQIIKDNTEMLLNIINKVAQRSMAE